MSVYNVSSSVISSAYDVSGSLLEQAYDIEGNELLVSYPSTFTFLHSEAISTGQSPQGMAIYGNYIFQFFTGTNKMKILSKTDYSLVNEMNCTIIGHGNNLQFGVDEQANGFPYLYCSDTAANVRAIYVISINLTQLSLVQTISLPSATGNFPNGVIDFARRKIYTIGYTGTSTENPSGNSNLFCILDLDNPSTVFSSQTFNYLGVMNGLVWDGIHVIMNANTFDGTDGKFYYINPTTGAIDHTVTVVKEYNSELQGMAEQTYGLLVSKWVYKTVSGTRTLFYEFYSLT